MVQRFLVPKFMDKNFNGYFRNTLAACFAFASEFGRLWCNFVFLDVHDVFDTWIDSFQQQTETNFSAKLRFAFFLEAACRFTTTSLEKKNVLEFEKFEMVFGTLVVNSTHVEFTPMEIETI